MSFTCCSACCWVASISCCCCICHCFSFFIFIEYLICQLGHFDIQLHGKCILKCQTNQRNLHSDRFGHVRKWLTIVKCSQACLWAEWVSLYGIGRLQTNLLSAATLTLRKKKSNYITTDGWLHLIALRWMLDSWLWLCFRLIIQIPDAVAFNVFSVDIDKHNNEWMDFIKAISKAEIKNKKII